MVNYASRSKVQNEPLNNFNEEEQVLTETDLPTPPAEGTLDVSLARDSEYFFA